MFDAFSSDAIPMHLITQDAMAAYLSPLSPRGVLARESRQTEPRVPAATPVWTDDFSNVFDVLNAGLF